MATNNETLNTKLNELIEAFQNLKDYLTFNKLPHSEKCEHLLNEAKELKNRSQETIESQIESLSKSFEDLKNEFVK